MFTTDDGRDENNPRACIFDTWSIKNVMPRTFPQVTGKDEKKKILWTYSVRYHHSGQSEGQDKVNGEGKQGNEEKPSQSTVEK